MPNKSTAVWRKDIVRPREAARSQPNEHYSADAFSLNKGIALLNAKASECVKRIFYQKLRQSGH